MKTWYEDGVISENTEVAPARNLAQSGSHLDHFTERLVYYFEHYILFGSHLDLSHPTECLRHLPRLCSHPKCFRIVISGLVQFAIVCFILDGGHPRRIAPYRIPQEVWEALFLAEELLSWVPSGLAFSFPTNEVCSICLEGMSSGKIVKVKGCEHLFHFDCIIVWVTLNLSCPTGRAVVQWSFLMIPLWDWVIGNWDDSLFILYKMAALTSAGPLPRHPWVSPGYHCAQHRLLPLRSSPLSAM